MWKIVKQIFCWSWLHTLHSMLPIIFMLGAMCMKCEIEDCCCSASEQNTRSVANKPGSPPSIAHPMTVAMLELATTRPGMSSSLRFDDMSMLPVLCIKSERAMCATTGAHYELTSLWHALSIFLLESHKFLNTITMHMCTSN